MGRDDEYDSGYVDTGSAQQRKVSILDKSDDGGNPTDIANPASAHFLLSNDVQDDLNDGGSKKMKCRSSIGSWAKFIAVDQNVTMSLPMKVANQ